MKPKGILIKDEKKINGITVLDFSINDVFDLIDYGSDLNWAILDLEVTGGDLGEKKWKQLMHFETSKEGITQIAWNDIKETSKKFQQIIFITLIGCKNPKLIKNYKNNSDMYKNCDIVIEVIDGGIFEVFSHDHALIDRLEKHFKDTEILAPDEQEI